MSPLPYRPHPLLKNGHLQTLMLGVLSGELPPYQARTLSVRLADGESLVVHEEYGAPIGKHAPLAILIHGLGGDHRSAYLQRLAPRLRSAGLAVWRVDMRGCGAGLHAAWKPANAGSSEDILAVVRTAAKSYSNIHLIGFSLSANIVLKLLGELGCGRQQAGFDQSRLRSALAVAPPVDLHHCADNMDRISRRVYTRYYLRNLARQVRLRQSVWPQWRVGDPEQVKTLREFDSVFTAPLSGYSSAEQYYSRASARPVLKHIHVPTTILIDRDDPIVTAHSLQPDEVNDATTRVITTVHGGHLGYYGIDETGRSIRWMEHFVLRYMQSQLARSVVD